VSNALFKTTNITNTPGTPGVPSFPGVAATPERMVWETQRVCDMQPASPGNWEYVITGYTSTRHWVPPPPNGGVPMVYVCQNLLVPVHVLGSPGVPLVAGVPGTAASLSYDYNLGWNSSSRSISFFKGDGYVEFDVPESTVGAVVGLNDLDVAASYVDIVYGFFVARGIARVYERGIERFYVGFVGSGRYRIERVAGVVRYYAAGALVYTSAVGSSTPMFLDSSLYSGGDLVDNPVLAGLTSSGASGPMDPSAPTVAGAITLLPFRISGGDAYARGDLTLRRVVAFGGSAARVSPNITTIMQQYADGVITEAQMYALLGEVASGSLSLLPPTIFAGSGARSAGLATLLPLTVDGWNNLAAPPYALASIATAYLQIGATGQQGSFGGADVSLPTFLIQASDHPYAAGTLTLTPLYAYGFTYEGPLEANVLTGVSIDPGIAGSYELALVMRSDLTLAAVLATQIVFSAQMDAALTVDAALAAIISQLNLTMTTPLGISTAAPPLDGDAQVWVLNMDSLGVSTYENFGFNSFAQLDGVYFGCKDDGLFALGGDTDAGALIRASINYGKLDFGSNALKQPQYAYIGVAASGTMYVKVTVDGVSYTYAALRSTTNLGTQRVEFGKGLKANYMQFEVYNKNGGDFELDNVEFQYVELTRRI
jgi:hypothetical protein